VLTVLSQSVELLLFAAQRFVQLLNQVVLHVELLSQFFVI
jgi:hypothetical protein